MKRLMIILFLMIFAVSFRLNAQDDDYGYFYASLSPYGSWIELNNGVTVWRPAHMHHGWAPYHYGHWVWTDDGWYWDSDEPYGYITYHYGRWYDDDYYGWIWVPDNVWAPAWVQWRYDDDYIGWAPLTPYANFSVSVGISFTNDYVTPVSYWNFVGYHHMCDVNVYNYYAPDRVRYHVYNDSRFRTNYGYSNGRVINRGVDVDYVRQRGGGRIAERKIQTVSDPRSTGTRGSNNVVRAYIPSREQIAKTNSRNVEIKRATRPTSMDVSRVEIGKRGNAPRNENNPANVNKESNRTENRNQNNAAPRENPVNMRENNRNNQPSQRENNRNNQPTNRSENNRPGKINNPPSKQENRPQRIESQPNTDNRNQSRQNNRPQINQQNRPQPRVQSQPQSRPQPRVESRPQPRIQNAPQPRVQSQPQSRPQPRVQSQPQSRPQPRPQNTERRSSPPPQKKDNRNGH